MSLKKLSILTPITILVGQWKYSKLSASSFLKERMMDVSDKYHIFVCTECNLPAVANQKTNTYECSNCNNYKGFKRVNIPYSCKLLMQELQCMSIAPIFITE